MFPRLYLVATPRPQYSTDEFLARVKAAVDGGVDILQLRCKDLEALPYLRLAEQVKPIAAAAGIPFIINDRPDVALAVGADGVHLGQQDLPVEHARAIFPKAMIGRSSHKPADAERAIAERATYFAVGPVWETPTKPGRKPAGLTYVQEVARRQGRHPERSEGSAVGGRTNHEDIPWFAIGGIDEQNISEVIEAGAERIACVRAILDAKDPAEAARVLRLALEGAAV